jgi:hypothetical protein
MRIVGGFFDACSTTDCLPHRGLPLTAYDGYQAGAQGGLRQQQHQHQHQQQQQPLQQQLQAQPLQLQQPQLQAQQVLLQQQQQVPLLPVLPGQAEGKLRGI